MSALCVPGLDHESQFASGPGFKPKQPDSVVNPICRRSFRDVLPCDGPISIMTGVRLRHVGDMQMVHLNRMKSWPWAYDDVINLPLTLYETEPWTPARPLADSRIALVSTAAVHRRDDKRFSLSARDFRHLGTNDRDLVQSHHSGDHDRTGFQQDLNLILPFDRLGELVEAGELGSVGQTHYSFLGGSPPDEMERAARKAAGEMKAEGVDTVLLCPV